MGTHKMEIWFIGGGRPYDEFLASAFQKRHVLIKTFSEDQFAERFLDFMLREITPLSIIVDVNCSSSIHLISKVLKTMDGLVEQNEVRLILLSNFLTWGGKSYHSSISDFEAEFKDRNPLACAYEQFCIENLLVRTALECHVDLSVVCTGILYGGAGLELEDIFSYMWGQDSNVKGCGDSAPNNGFTLSCNATAVVPLTYVASFTSQVIDLALCQDRWPTLVAVIDKPRTGVAPSFLDTVSALNVSLNSFRPAASTSTSVSSTIRAADGPTCSTGQALWKCNIPVAATAPFSSVVDIPSFQVEGFGPVWEEYLAAKALDPVSVMVVGPPRSGKSELANRIADLFQVELITIDSAVKFTFSLNAQEPLEEEIKVQSHNSCLWAIKADLRTAVETKANEGKKPAKGAATAVSSDGAITDDAFTPALCQSLPIDLLRKCVSVQAQLHPRCRRRGFVLDVWDGKQLVAGASSLADTLSALSLTDKPLQHVQLIIELQCRANLPVERLIAVQGAQAKAKESQAAVKALESLISAYNSDLIPLLSVDNSSNDAAEHTNFSHKGVLEIIASSSTTNTTTAVTRVDLSTETPSPSWEEVAATALQTLMATRRGGRIGWLPEPALSEATIIDDVSATATVSSPDAHSTTKDAFEGAPPVVLSDGGKGNGSSHSQCATAAASISDQLKELDAVKLQTLTQKADKLQAFLSSTVLPQLAEHLVRIQREQPADPIMFLAEQLARCSADKHSHAQDRAHLRFTELLLQGEY